MIPDIIEIKKNLEDIKQRTKNLKIIVAQIKNMMDHSLKIIEKYYDIAQDIIGKYESYNKKLKNFQVLETIRCLSDSNKEIMNDLNKIISENKTKEDWINKCKILIEIFKCDREFYIGEAVKTDEIGKNIKNGGIETERKYKEKEENIINIDNFGKTFTTISLGNSSNKSKKAIDVENKKSQK